MKPSLTTREQRKLSQKRRLNAIAAILFLFFAQSIILDFDETAGHVLYEESPVGSQPISQSGKNTNGEELQESRPRRWNENEIVSYIAAHPQRAYFAHLFGYGGFRKGIEIGVQDGRFSSIFMEQNRFLKERWSMALVDPDPTDYLNKRMDKENGSWKNADLLKNCDLKFHKTISTDPELLNSYPDGYFDFVYLDGSHTHDAVKAELPLWWPKVRSGGILAGHDYCNYGEKGLPCNGCDSIPLCGDYTDKSTKFSVESARYKKGRAGNQVGVVMAVQEWMMNESGDSTLTVHYTLENFTRESLAKDGFEFDDIIRRDRNPSWFIYKP